MTSVPTIAAPADAVAGLPVRVGRRHAALAHLRQDYVALLGAQVAIAAASAVVNVLTARALLPDGRGRVALLLQLGYLGSQVLLLGTERSFVAEYHGSPVSTASRAYRRLLVFPAGVGLSLAAALAVVPINVLSPWRLTLVVAAVFAVANGYVRATRAVAIAAARARTFLWYTIGSQFLLMVLAAVLFGVHNDAVVWWLAAYAVSSAAPMAVCLLRWGSGTPPVRWDEDRRLRAVRGQGFALLPSSLSNTAMLRFDRLLLPALSSLAALGLYAAVATLTELLAWPAQAFADARIGHWRAHWRAGRLRPSAVVAPVLVYVAIATPVLAVAVYLAVVPLLGQAFAPARALVLPLTLAAACYAVSRALLAVLVARRSSWRASAADGLGFAVSLVGYIALIPGSGARGAAYASLFGYLACLVCAAVMVRQGAGTAPVNDGEGVDAA